MWREGEGERTARTFAALSLPDASAAAVAWAEREDLFTSDAIVEGRESPIVLVRDASGAVQRSEVSGEVVLALVYWARPL